MIPGDHELLASWLAQPHVRATEWEEHDPKDVVSDFPIGDDDPTIYSIVMEDDRPVAMIQDYLIDDYPEWQNDVAVADTAGAVGIDYLIGEPDSVGRGLGPMLITSMLPGSGPAIRTPRL